MPTRRTNVVRRRVIAGFFTVLGLVILWGYAPLLGAEEPLISRLALDVPTPVIPVPTVETMLLIGVFYLASGILGFVPRAARVGTPMLWVSGALIFPAVLIAAAAGAQTNVQTMISETLRLGTPLALGALAGIYSERAGVVNIAIEGMMLMGAAFGFLVFVYTGNIWIGVGAALLIGALNALLHAVLSISFKTDQIVSGTVINILAIGVTGYVRRTFLINAPSGRTTLPEIPIPLLSEIPFLGKILFTEKPIFYTMILLIIGSHIVLFYTRWGLRARAVGENPRAADTVGINVYRTRYLNVIISGMIAGLAGAWFSLETVGSFDDGMTAGKGFIALAAMIFGKWTPFGAFGGAMLFGFADALGTRFQILQIELFGAPLPAQFLQILPYVVTIIVLAGLIGRATPPAAVGQPYEK
jgi:simple sugar transport system permease protein